MIEGFKISKYEKFRMADRQQSHPLMQEQFLVQGMVMLHHLLVGMA